MDVYAFEEITRASFRPKGVKNLALVGIMDGTSGRREFSSGNGWRMTRKLRNQHGTTIEVIVFTEHIMWMEAQAKNFRDYVVRMGPFKRVPNAYSGYNDIQLLPTTNILKAMELTETIKPFATLCVGWPSEAEFSR